MFPLALTQQPQIDAAVRQVTAQLHPDVQHIRWEIEKDWSDQWAIFFRVVLSDEAGDKRLREVATNVIRRLAERIFERCQSRLLFRKKLGRSAWRSLTTC